MKFPFQPLPTETTKRPVVPLHFKDLPGVQMLGLVDSGALGTRFPGPLAAALNIDLTSVEVSQFRLHGQDYHYRTARVDVVVGGRVTRPMHIDFVDGWKYGHVLLGISGFFDEFVVRIDAPRKEVSLSPARHPSHHAAAG